MILFHMLCCSSKATISAIKKVSLRQNFKSNINFAKCFKISQTCSRDAIVLPIIDCLTSWFAGCVIFVNLGYMAHSSGLGIGEVISQGISITNLHLKQSFVCLNCCFTSQATAKVMSRRCLHFMGLLPKMRMS